MPAAEEARGCCGVLCCCPLCCRDCLSLHRSSLPRLPHSRLEHKHAPMQTRMQRAGGGSLDINALCSGVAGLLLSDDQWEPKLGGLMAAKVGHHICAKPRLLLALDHQ
jgi:hypothetical protein